MSRVEFSYKGWKIEDAIMAIFAYDEGCPDSGVRDVLMKEVIKNYLKGLKEESFRLFISRFIRDQFLTEETLEKGCSIEDVVCFISWLDREMGISF